MGELRKDYILDRYVIISSGRSKRPRQFKTKEKEKVKICYFCPGNESTTPDEIGSIKKNGKWQMRWFANKFPAVAPEGQSDIRTDNTFFTFSANYGYHEVIVETNDHSKQLADLSITQLKTLLEVFNQRIKELSKKENIKYVSIIKNHGKNAGTSLVHSHCQVFAINHLPKTIMDKIEASKKFDRCPYCDIINIEKQSFRRCFENDSFAAFTPYASMFNYEIVIFPKEHVKTLDEIKDLKGLADILKKCLVKISELDVSYNLYLNYAPQGSDLHFHIEIIPRVATWGGFEFSTGTIINSVPPEDAAKFYRGEDESS